ncbi:hypothetical protein JCM33374_g2326 [Metschnikowia sp. JCM 33374]|nr:hypothetical protein JCM33374_g2326 [Metschnikowia sp. JCM 33374]
MCFSPGNPDFYGTSLYCSCLCCSSQHGTHIYGTHGTFQQYGAIELSTPRYPKYVYPQVKPQSQNSGSTRANASGNHFESKSFDSSQNSFVLGEHIPDTRQSTTQDSPNTNNLLETIQAGVANTIENSSHELSTEVCSKLNALASSCNDYTLASRKFLLKMLTDTRESLESGDFRVESNI